MSDFEQFVRERLNELHPHVFGVAEPKAHHALAYFAYHRLMRERFNKGTDYSGHPRNPFA